MKIGIDCRLWNETGVGRYVRNLVDQLLKIDKKNTYILFVQSKDYEQINSQCSRFNVQLVKVDIRWHSLEEQVKFPKLLEKEHLDLMHFPYFSVPIRYKRPFVITIHDLILHHFGTGKASTLPAPLYKLKHAGYKYVLSQAAKHAQTIIVPLETVKKDVMGTL
ncbi:MAG TPA: glycosyltransferase, partial [Allocoleopsis sp.]